MKGGEGRLRLLCCPGKHCQKQISDIIESLDLDKKGSWTLFLIMKHPILLIKARIDTCTQQGTSNSPRTRIKSKNKS